MPRLLWDASALAKRYTFELGRLTANALFSTVPASDMVATTLGYAETFGTLIRHLSNGRLSEEIFRAAVSALNTEIIEHADFSLLSSDAATFASLNLINAHNLHTSDAIILATFLRYVAALPADSPPCVLIAADHRLFRAAQAEGLPVINPEQLSPDDALAFLAAL